MKIKRFMAKDIRGAIARVRKELGADAVILSNRVTTGGVEIVAAVDYDEELFQDVSTVTAPKTRQASSSPSSENSRADSNRYADLEQRVTESQVFAGAEVPVAPPRQPATSPGEGVVEMDESAKDMAVPAKSGANKLHRSSGAISRQRISTQQQEPDDTLIKIRQELDDMKGLLEHQLSGLAWGDKARRHPMQPRLLQLLLGAGFQPGLCEQIADKVPCEGGFDRMRRMALGLLAHRLAVLDGDLVEQGGVVALVGPTGVGKTTTLAKLAARAVLSFGAGKLALITTDNYRVGAHEQLRTFGRLLDVPVRVARNTADLDQLLKKLADKHLILIDTAGVSQRDTSLVKRLQTLDIKKMIRSYLVLSATTEITGLEEIIWQFQQVGLAGCILTKLDEAVLMGSVISAVIKYGLPIACITDGQRVPEDLKIAKPHVLISRAIAMALRCQQQGQKLKLNNHFVATDSADRVAMAMAFGRS